MQENNHRVLLYYQFVSIDHPENFAAEHKAFCASLNLKGRILVAKEGINGTVSGTLEETNAYMDHMKKDPRFQSMVFKIHEEDHNVFRKLYVKHRDSIITLLPEDDVNPRDLVGTYLTPTEWEKKLQEDDVILLDGRNGYEYDLGHFRGAIRPDITNFKEFPQWIEENLGDQKDKKILAYCTGGIRCEKLTGVLLNKGFKDVYHLEGGIVTYGQDKETKGRHWDGKCYVFDERIAVPINQEEDVVVATCIHCNTPSENHRNCVNDDCHLQHFCCPACEEKNQGFCSEACKSYIAKNPHRDGRVRLQEKAALYALYKQGHAKAKEVQALLKEGKTY